MQGIGIIEIYLAIMGTFCAFGTLIFIIDRIKSKK